MRRSKFTDTQIASILKEADAGHPVYELSLIHIYVFPAQRLERFAQWWIMRPVPIQAATYGTLLLIYAGMTLEAPSFIYFQF